MKPYTTKERKFLKDNIELKQRWDKGLKIETADETIMQMGEIQLKYFDIEYKPGCASCASTLFRNLYNKLNNEKRKRK